MAEEPGYWDTKEEIEQWNKEDGPCDNSFRMQGAKKRFKNARAYLPGRKEIIYEFCDASSGILNNRLAPSGLQMMLRTIFDSFKKEEKPYGKDCRLSLNPRDSPEDYNELESSLFDIIRLASPTEAFARDATSSYEEELKRRKQKVTKEKQGWEPTTIALKTEPKTEKPQDKKDEKVSTEDKEKKEQQYLELLKALREKKAQEGKKVS